jgi:hypothetical protein
VLNFQQADTKLTLAEGLREYYSSRDGLVGGRGVPDSAREFFRCHDAAHVVFGCDTTLPDEAAVKICSVFGTTGGFGVLKGYRSPESKEIYEKLELGPIVTTALRSFPIVARAFSRCRKMTKRWPWSDFDACRDVGLNELRREYGIRAGSAG